MHLRLAILAMGCLVGYCILLPREKSVVLFEQCAYVGRQHALKTGSYPTAQLGIADNALSSIHIPEGLAVQVFAYDGYGGPTATFTASTSCLPEAWNDQVSAVRVYALPPSAAGTRTPRPGRTPNATGK